MQSPVAVAIATALGLWLECIAAYIHTTYVMPYEKPISVTVRTTDLYE